MAAQIDEQTLAAGRAKIEEEGLDGSDNRGARHALENGEDEGIHAEAASEPIVTIEETDRGMADAALGDAAEAADGKKGERA